MEQRSASGGTWAVALLRVIGLWVLAGALMKLFLGSPVDLPRVVRDLPIDTIVSYRVAIAAELCIGLLALLRPRWSWLLVIALLVLFLGALVMQVVHNEASCGCFGSRLVVSPKIMLGLDGLLLVLLLFSRPWAIPGSDATGGIIAMIVVAGAVVLPWVVNRQAAGPDDVTQGLPQFVLLDMKSWPGKHVTATEIGPWIDVKALPADALWIFYRESCPVCADVLGRLAVTEGGQREIVLVRLPDADEGDEVKVHEKPAGAYVQEVDLDDRIEWAVVPPAAMVTRDGRIVWAAEGLTLESFQELEAQHAEETAPGGG
ncbi:MAG: MauE/DoxX family redox-associated membrane protein [Planctomycetota bacterium]